MGKINQIGISISDASIEMIQVSKSGKAPGRVLTFAVGPIPAGVINRGVIKEHEKLVKALEAVYSTAKPKPFNTKDVSVALPDSVAFTHIFKFPGAMSEEDVASTLKFEAEDIIPYPIDDLYVTFKIIKQNEERTDVLFVGAPHDVVDGYVAVFEEAGFKLKELEVEASTLIRSLIKSVGKDQAVLIMDLGATNSRFTIADEEGLNGSFSLPVGGNMITETIASKLSISSREAELLKRKKAAGKSAAIVNEAVNEYLEKIIQKTKQVIDWYAREDTAVINKIVLTGGGSGLIDLTEKLAQKFTEKKLSIDITFGNPWQEIDEKTAPKPANTSGRIFAPAIGAIPLSTNKLVPEIDLMDVVGKKRNPFKSIKSVKQTVDTMAKEEPSGDKEPMSIRRLSVLINQYNAVFAIIAAAIILGAIGFLVYWLVFADRNFREPARLVEPTDVQQPILNETATGDLITTEQGELTIKLDTEARTNDIVAANFNEVSSYGTSFLYPLEGTEIIDGTATGTVALFNNTGTDQPLVATTRLLSEDGILFRLEDDVVVPAGSSIFADVYADQDGVSGDIGPTAFTIPGLSESLQEDIYATSSAAMTGGIVEGSFFTEAVYEEALIALRDELIKTPLNLFGTVSEDEIYLSELSILEPLDLVPSVSYGETTDSVELIGTVRIRALSFSESNLETVIKNTLDDQTIELKIITIIVQSVDSNLKSAELNITYEIK